MAPASAPLLPAAAKRPASDAEATLLPQDGESGKNQQQLECPRCKSGNTKFCYYNNYSTTQPRHFCRACRRYWTHGGTLRNVPVGGACRRGGNKRRRSAEPSPSSAASPAEDAYRSDILTTPLFPFLSDGVFLPQLDLGLGGGAATLAGFPWTPASAAPDLYDELPASWGWGETLSTGAWDDFTTGIEFTWPLPAGN
ncbi:unnamed protein product [Alopecurus aequalis]